MSPEEKLKEKTALEVAIDSPAGEIVESVEKEEEKVESDGGGWGDDDISISDEDVASPSKSDEKQKESELAAKGYKAEDHQLNLGSSMTL